MAELDWGSADNERTFSLVYDKLYKHRFLTANKLARVKDEDLMDLVKMAADDAGLATLEATLAGALCDWLRGERDDARRIRAADDPAAFDVVHGLR